LLLNLDKRDSLALKGIAITAIVFHNFFHVICPVYQDEFTFDASRFWTLINTSHDPVRVIEALFVFFGHFGVEVFVFLSAYGLARSHWDDSAHWAGFVWGRIKKLYPMFGLVILPWLAIVMVTHGSMQVLKEEGVKLFWMLAGVSNLIPGYGLPPVGPWWFIPFIIQFYALWPLLRRYTIRFGVYGLLALSALCLVLVSALNPWLNQWSMTLLDTPIGHMPEFCLGIIAARYPVRLSARIVPPAVASLILGSLYRSVWPLTYVAALFLILAGYLWMRKPLRKSRLLVRSGQYSILIFLLNGVVRTVFLHYSTTRLSGLLLGCVNAVATFVLAALIHEFVMPATLAARFQQTPPVTGEA
jgi:peptidoglycan/LPS O-acetylase OafA/YrhL